MRKYIAVGAVAFALITGQAIASDSAVLNLGDRVGAPSDSSSNLFGVDDALLVLLTLAAAGLGGWAISSATSHGTPASP